MRIRWTSRFEDAVEKRVEAAGEFVDVVGGALRSRGRRAQQVGVSLDEHGLEKGCLGGEVVIERARGDPRLASEVVDGGGTEAVLTEQTPAGGDQRGVRLSHLRGTQRRRLPGFRFRHLLLLVDDPPHTIDIVSLCEIVILSGEGEHAHDIGSH